MLLSTEVSLSFQGQGENARKWATLAMLSLFMLDSCDTYQTAYRQAQNNNIEIITSGDLASMPGHLR